MRIFVSSVTQSCLFESSLLSAIDIAVAGVLNQLPDKPLAGERHCRRTRQDGSEGHPPLERAAKCGHHPEVRPPQPNGRESCHRFELSAEDMRLIATLDLNHPQMLDLRKPSEAHRLFNRSENPVLASL